MFDFSYFLSTFWLLIPALPITFLIALVSFIAGGILGFILALIRLYDLPVLNPISIMYISIFRGTPILVQLFMFYYGIPIFLKTMGMDADFANIDALYCALLVFTLYASAYLSEIFRAALLSVDKGQREAAYSLGMTNAQTLRRIVIPQSLMNTLPNLLNFFIMNVKNTSVASIITVGELMGLADITSGRDSKFLEVYIMVALLYWIICVVLECIFSKFEHKFKKFGRGYT